MIPRLAEGEPDLAAHWNMSGFPLSGVRDHRLTILKDHSGVGLRKDCRGQRDPMSRPVRLPR